MALLGLIIICAIIFFVVRSKKKKAPAKAAPVVQQPIAEAQPRTSENIKVAGVSYRQDEILSFAQENADFNLTKKQIIDRGMEDRQIYKYNFPELPAEFVAEPDNEYDPNAIAIYVQGKKIGYVKKGSTSHIRNLINSGKLKSATCHFRGGPSKCYDSLNETLEKFESEYSAKIEMKFNEGA